MSMYAIGGTLGVRTNGQQLDTKDGPIEDFAETFAWYIEGRARFIPSGGVPNKWNPQRPQSNPEREQFVRDALARF